MVSRWADDTFLDALRGHTDPVADACAAWLSLRKEYVVLFKRAIAVESFDDFFTSALILASEIAMHCAIQPFDQRGAAVAPDSTECAGASVGSPDPVAFNASPHPPQNQNVAGFSNSPASQLTGKRVPQLPQNRMAEEFSKAQLPQRFIGRVPVDNVRWWPAGCGECKTRARVWSGRTHVPARMVSWRAV